MNNHSYPGICLSLCIHLIWSYVQSLSQTCCLSDNGGQTRPTRMTQREEYEEWACFIVSKILKTLY